MYNNIITAICAINEKMLCGKSVESERYKEKIPLSFAGNLPSSKKTTSKRAREKERKLREPMLQDC